MGNRISQSHSSKKITSDLLWSFGAVMLLNGIIQIVIYPLLQRRLGTDGYGEMLYHLSLITILGSGVGMAANNYRLLTQNDENLANGDYLLCLLSMLLVGCVPIFCLTVHSFRPPTLALYLLLGVLIGLRYYSDVAYRLTLNYRMYFLYYAVLSAGYLIGMALWPLLHSWVIVLLIGEAACVLLCVFRGGVYAPLQKKKPFWDTEKQILILSASYLLYNGVIQMDRVLLRNLLGSEAVSLYYVASLLGKILALVVGPLNAVMLSHLSKAKDKLSKKAVLLILTAIVGVSGFFFLIISLTAPWITGMLYPDIDCGNMLFLANLGQVLCFAGSLILTVLLTMAPSYWQFLNQGIYVLVFVLAGYWGAAHNGLNGFITGILYANILRFVIAAAALLFAVRQHAGRRTEECS